MNTTKMTLWALMAALFFLLSTAVASTEAEAQQVKTKKSKKKRAKRRSKRTWARRFVLEDDFFIRGGLGLGSCIHNGSSCSELVQSDQGFTLEFAFRYRHVGIGFGGGKQTMRLDAASIDAEADRSIGVVSTGINLFYFPVLQRVALGTLDPWLALRLAYNELRDQASGGGFGMGLRGGVDLFIHKSSFALTPLISYDVVFPAGHQDPLHIWSAQIALSWHWIGVRGAVQASGGSKPRPSAPPAPSTPKPRPRY